MYYSGIYVEFSYEFYILIQSLPNQFYITALIFYLTSWWVEFTYLGSISTCSLSCKALLPAACMPDG